VRAIVLSDLHLGAPGTATDDAFISFVEWLTEGARRDATPTRLVLLGDLLDLLHAPIGARDPLAALDAVAARHRSALAALGAAAANDVLVSMLLHLHRSYPRDLSRTVLGESSTLLEHNVREHEAILDAIERRDPRGASAALTHHLHTAEYVRADALAQRTRSATRAPNGGSS